MYKSIIVAVDLSHADRGADILELGKKLCDTDGKITVVHAIAAIPTYIETYIPDDILEQNRTDAEARLAVLCESANLDAHISVRHGQPHDEILVEADHQNADLILVASHHPGLTDYLIGSTAARVVRHAQCSVLVDR